MSVRLPQRSQNTILAEFVFILLPTFLVSCFLLWQGSLSNYVFKHSYLSIAIVMGVGMLLSLFLHHTRLRFLPTFIVLVLIGSGASYVLSKIYYGDVDVFLIGQRFGLYFLFFCVGWVVSFGFLRWRLWAIVMAILTIVIGIVLIAQQLAYFDTTASIWGTWLRMLIPLVVYSIYIIFISVQIQQQKKTGKWLFGTTILNTILFIVLALSILSSILFFTKNEIKSTLQNYGAGKNQNNAGSVIKKNDDGSYSLSDKTSLGGNNSKDKTLLFAAYIDNFFEDGYPNPLYLTAFYYAKYDTATETFERVNDMPDKDLFAPQPNKIPLYNAKTDSSVLRFGKEDKFKKTVELEVYNKNLNDDDFVAPTTSFFIQPIAVDKAFQKEYKSAYRAKSLVSELNSAYFVYNSSHPTIQQFQSQRFAALRTVKDFSEMDAEVFRYYTQYPNAPNLKPISDLAHKITLGKNTPIDKIIAVRDYFLSKDATGNPLFKYSDNPGIPDIPSTSKLSYFLFESHSGYCAHYSGATLFMLRALGIPSRITVGFLTQDRSTNNKGWYYFYADQAHAWVQVYFPGFGWLDFDTTVGNDDARESNQTDATPPLQPSKAVLAINGIITAIDTAKKTIEVNTGNLVYDDKTFERQQLMTIAEDVSQASFYNDTLQIDMGKLKVGDTVASISYDRNIIKEKKDFASFDDVLKALAQPIAIDQIVLNLNKSKKETSQQQEEKVNKSTVRKWLLLLLGILLIASIIVLPRIVKGYIVRAAKNSTSSKKKYYYYYLATKYLLWMYGYKRGDNTPLYFAKEIDESFDLNYSNFIQSYLQQKYSTQSLSDNQDANQFYILFEKRFLSQVPKEQKKWAWWRIDRTINFLRTELK